MIDSGASARTSRCYSFRRAPVRVAFRDGRGHRDPHQPTALLLRESWGAQTVEEFPIKSISSISVESKRGGEKLKIHASGNISEISNMFYGHGDELARQVRKLMEERDAPPAAALAAAPSAADRLKQLAELRDAGIIDEAEFAEKKAERRSGAGVEPTEPWVARPHRF